jgi:putative addiction module killer protein
LRIHSGPGYRVYCARKGGMTFVLLCGGTKSGQRRDIAMAMQLARELKQD